LKPICYDIPSPVILFSLFFGSSFDLTELPEFDSRIALKYIVLSNWNFARSWYTVWSTIVPSLRASETEAALHKSAEWWLTMDSLWEHPDDDSLERYLRGAMDDKELPGIEEHLLICHACVEKAERLQRYLETMRQATGTRKSSASAARRGKPN